jgi:hypothetical protein
MITSSVRTVAVGEGYGPGSSTGNSTGRTAGSAIAPQTIRAKTSAPNTHRRRADGEQMPPHHLGPVQAILVSDRLCQAALNASREGSRHIATQAVKIKSSIRAI